MKRLITGFIASVGLFVASTLSTACVLLWFDEPTPPEDLIK